MNILIRIFASAGVLLLVSYIVPGIEFSSAMHALVAALVLGLLNVFIKPLLVLFTLPITLLSLGLFIFVINAVLFMGAAWLLDGFAVDSFLSALMGSLLVSVLNALLNFFLR